MRSPYSLFRGQFVGPLLQFAEEPRVLDRDDRLVGKSADQLDLPVGVWLHSSPRESNHAEHGPLAQQRHPSWVGRTDAALSGTA